MPTVDRNGVKMHYEVRGNVPAILVTHGFAASSRMFQATSDALADIDPVIALVKPTCASCPAAGSCVA
jgi:pimeloyl-ACP methyl ester carboxylesterase